VESVCASSSWLGESGELVGGDDSLELVGGDGSLELVGGDGSLELVGGDDSLWLELALSVITEISELYGDVSGS